MHSGACTYGFSPLCTPILMPLVDCRQFDEPAMSNRPPYSTMMVYLMLTSFAGLTGDVLDVPPLLDNSLNSQGSDVEHLNIQVGLYLSGWIINCNNGFGISDGSRITYTPANQLSKVYWGLCSSSISTSRDAYCSQHKQFTFKLPTHNALTRDLHVLIHWHSKVSGALKLFEASYCFGSVFLVGKVNGS